MGSCKQIGGPCTTAHSVCGNAVCETTIEEVIE